MNTRELLLRGGYTRSNDTNRDAHVRVDDVLLEKYGAVPDFSFATLSQFKHILSKSGNSVYPRVLEFASTQDDSHNPFISLSNPSNLSVEPTDTREFAGIPLVVKDNIDVVGFPTTCGSVDLTDNRPSNDATLVKRLKSAGFIVCGKTNLTEFANFYGDRLFHRNTESEYGGITFNAHDTSRTPGSSSCGSAVAVAHGCFPASIGSATFGSMILPATYNGVSCIRPTVGLVSTNGIAPISNDHDTPGSYAHSARDCSKILQIISGKDPTDPWTDVIPNDFNYDALTQHSIDREYRITAWYPTFNDTNQNNLLQPHIDTMLKLLKASGFTTITTKDFGTITELNAFNENVYESFVNCMHYRFHKDMTMYLENSNSRIKSVQELIVAYKVRSKSTALWEYSLMFDDESRYIERRDFVTRTTADFIENAFSDSDCIVAITRNPAEPLDNLYVYTTASGSPLSWELSMLFSVAKCPHVCIPFALFENLPLTLSIVAKPWKDDVALRVADKLQSILRFFPMPQ